MGKSIAIIGAGQIGFAVAAEFRLMDWNVTVHARSKPPWHDRDMAEFQPYELGDGPAPLADVVVDTIAYDAGDIDRYDPDEVERLIVISSASVYCDDQGRTLDEAAQNGFPEFDGPITEKQSTVAPGPQTYSTRKVRMEQRAIELFGDRATILRPCAIYGPYSRHPREWWFVKRMLDGRARIPLAFGGASQFQTTAASSIARFVSHSAENSVGGTFNIADATAPSVLEIGEAIASLLGRGCEFLVPDGAPRDGVGQTPWSVPRPMIIDGMKAANEANLAAVTYGAEARDSVQWLRDLNPADWRAAFPQLAAYPWELFDYAAEDAMPGKIG